MKIIGFSGPPHSGKDSIADAIGEQLRGKVTGAKMSLAAPMRRVGMTLLGFDPLDHEAYARLKEEPQKLFGRTDWEPSSDVGIGESPGFNYRTDICDNLRQFMIALSENFMKPRYGYDFWARLLYTEALALGLDEALILVPDFGFHSEVKFFEDTVGWQNLMVVQVEREGCDFAKDSRNYVSGSQTYPITNNKTIEYAAQLVLDVATHQFSWSL